MLETNPSSSKVPGASRRYGVDPGDLHPCRCHHRNLKNQNTTILSLHEIGKHSRLILNFEVGGGSMVPWALVTPASRGIGFHLTRHLLRNTSLPVVATARKDIENVKKTILDDLKDVDENRLRVLNLDVTGILPLAAPNVFILKP
jgi:hypothetical protein